MSKSWMVMSRKIPPEIAMYSSGGGAGSRLVIRTICGSPLSGAANPACAGSKRRVEEGWNEAAVKADLERHAGGLHGSERAVELRQLQRHRLLAEDRLARLGGRDD